MRKTKRITILIPAYNEQDVLPYLYERLKKLGADNPAYAFDLLFVNDGSSDNTLEIIKSYAEAEPNISYVNLSRNYGKEIAMVAGLDHSTGDASVIIDADLQDPPELITEMIKYWEEGYDDVYARRNSRQGEAWLKKITSTAFYKVLKHSTRIPIQQDTGDFRLLDKRAVEAIRGLRESQRYTKGMFSWIGYKKKEIVYDRDPRIAGKSKWNYFKLVDLAIEGIVSFTTAPLRWASVLGLIVSLLAFVYILYIIVRTAFYGTDLAGYPSMMAVILFLGGIQLLSLGIIGEYIARIFIETKDRPLYFVEDYHAGRHQK